MDTKRAYKNIVFSGIFRIVVLLLTIPVRSLMIANLGNEITGLYSLFNSLISVLSIAESGIGISIIYSMYKHIRNNNEEELAGLYQVFKKIYRIIAVIVLVLGIIVGLFLSLFNDTDIAPIHVYIPYFMMVLSAACSYFFAAKISVINAYKDNFKTTVITSVGYALQYALQIISLIFIKSFIVYTSIIFVGVMIQWILTNIYFNQGYRQKLGAEPLLSDSTKNELKTNIKSMFVHKVGNILFTTTPSLVISFFLGVTIVGVYTNYYTILIAVSSIFTVMFSSITSVVGHAIIEGDNRLSLNYYKIIRVINLALGIILFLGFMAIQNVFIPIVFDSGIVLSNHEIVLLSVSQFAIFMRQTNIVFKEASGLFYDDRKRPVIEVIVNLLLSMILINWIGMSGVFIASILSTMLLSDVMESFVLYKKLFQESPISKIIEDFLILIVFLILSFVIIHYNEIYMTINDHFIFNFLLNGVTSVIISFVLIVILFYNKKNKALLQMIRKDYQKIKGEK